MEKSIYQDIIDEIGTQTLARLGLNIFNLNSYHAYGASVAATNITFRSQNQHSKNPKAFGFAFENLDVGQKNIHATLYKTGEKTFTGDELADIKKAMDISSSGKKIENLNLKDRANFEFIHENYADVIKNWNPNYENAAKKNHDATDVYTFDKNNNLVKKSQHKVIKNTNELLKDRYLENNDVFTVPFDDYIKHKKNLEKKIQDQALSSEDRNTAKKALDMLEKNNKTNRLMAENPKATAILTQASIGTLHLVQTGISDAIVSSLSTLANGVLYEIKDIYISKEEISIKERSKRLLNTTITEFNNSFKRGCGFAITDILIDSLSQIFKTIFSQLKYIWRSMREAAKSIYNAVYSYIKDEIKTKEQLISSIIKALVSASVVINTIALENKLHILLSPLVTPVISAFLAPTLAISMGAIASVFISKQIDTALTAFFTVFAERDLSKERYEKIITICDEYLPKLTSKNNELEALMNETHKERKNIMSISFLEFTRGVANNDSDKITAALSKINILYGKELCFTTQKQFDDFMDSESEFTF